MALCFEIELGSVNQEFDIKRLLSSNMGYGVYEDAYRLHEGVIGSPTVIFDAERIGRGVEVDVEEGKLVFSSSVPSTNSDVELLFNLLQRAMELTGAKEMIFDEKAVACGLSGELKDEIKQIHQKALRVLEDALEDENQRQLLIHGATQVVSIDRQEARQMVESWDEFGEYLHRVQAQDLYFAVPMFLERNDGILALYILSDGVRSSFPLEKNFLVDTEQLVVSKWAVGFFDRASEDLMGMIPYDDFLADVLDAERFIVKLDIDAMKELLEKYGEAL